MQRSSKWLQKERSNLRHKYVSGSTSATVGSMVPEFIMGGMYEHCEVEELPLAPRRTLDVRSLEVAGRSPGPFPFVEWDIFQVLVGLVILSNMLFIVYVWYSNGSPADISTVERACLTVYVIELVLRIVHYGRFFFFDWFLVVIWNYFDFSIVCLGLLDEFVLACGHEKILAFRTFRLLRLLRVIRLFWLWVVRGDFEWVESYWFQLLSAGLIVANAILMGLETEIESPLWWWVNQGFLLFITFEITVRVRDSGLLRFLWQSEEDKLWNWLDATIVFTGVIDQWIIPLCWLLVHKSQEQGQLGPLMMTVRILRLMRILRLLRLVKAVRPLYSLAIGIMQALQSMLWVLLLTMVALYACALLTTNLIGKAMIDRAELIDPDARALFKDVPESLFTLFGLMNSQFWEDIGPIFDVLPWAKPVWVMFTVLSSWALLSVMTGVVSENMLTVRQQQEQKDCEQLEELRLNILRLLKEVFTAVDKDSNGRLEKQEYLDILASPYHMRKLQKIANVHTQDFMSIFEWIDVDDTGSINFGEFISAFEWLNEPLTGKSLLKLETALRQRVAAIEKSMRKISNNMKRVDVQRMKQIEEMSNVLTLAKDRFEAEAAAKDHQAEQAEAAAQEFWTRCETRQRVVAEQKRTEATKAEEASVRWQRSTSVRRTMTPRRDLTTPAHVESRTLASIAARLGESISRARSSSSMGRTSSRGSRGSSGGRSGSRYRSHSR